MLAATRAVRICRSAIPYATWVSVMIQLGYFGYNMIQLYQRYLAQRERDAREGRNRTLDETIELVVKPKRKRFLNSLRANSTSRPEQDILPVARPSGSTDATNPSNNEKNNSISEDKENMLNLQEDSRDVTIIYDSSTDGPLNTPTVNEIEMDEDVMSTVSTSIESTDSNEGIVKDIYSHCFICACDLNNPNKSVATLPFCLHPFHKSCLDGVLKWHPKCPVCDFHIFSPI